MITWFLFALGSAISQSGMNALSNRAVKLGQFSKITVGFIGTATASMILLLITFIFFGIPDLKPGFWHAVFVTGALNIVMLPTGLKAYEFGEFSSVYSMTLATPIFLLFTGWIFLGEVPPMLGMFGVVLSVLGLWQIAKAVPGRETARDFKKGNILALSVAFMASISVNFDKLAVLYSNKFFSYGVISGVMALGYAAYLLFNSRSLMVRTNSASAPPENPLKSIFFLEGIFLLVLIGMLQALNGIFYNSALAIGFASYTIAIKRLGVLFGVIWGWLFFREKNISKKLLGAGIAIAGVILILFS